MAGELESLKGLLQSEAAKSINTFDDAGFTPLMWAARNGHIQSVELLIQAGSDVNAHDESTIGNTALGEIAGEASLEMVDTLLKAGADPTIRGWMQLNALDRAKERKTEEGCKVYDLLKIAAAKFKTK